MRTSVLILDYSTDKTEAPCIRRYLPQGISTEIYVYFDEPIPDLKTYTHIIHTGSSLSICRDADFYPEVEKVIHKCIDLGMAQMGICYGHQLICRALCGSSAVRNCVNGLEVGWNTVELCNGFEIDGIERECRVFESHFDEVVMLPEGSEITMTNQHSEIQAFVNKPLNLFGVQFHPEFDLHVGNDLIEDCRKLFEEHGIDVNAVLKGSPSIDAGKVFFSYFMRSFDRKGV